MKMEVCELAQTRRLFNTLLLCCAVVFLSKGSYARLNVFIDADEVSRFLPDLHNSLYLVKNGKVATMLKRPLRPSLIPPIHPEIRGMRFKFNASTQVKYSLSFRSSNESVMQHPKASIPLQGSVPRKTKGFKIIFPCTAKSSGEVLLSINISFRTKSGRLLWGPLQLSLRRTCSFVIRARIESKVQKNGRRQLRVRVTKNFKQGRVKINKRQLLERRGSRITCDCSDLKLRRSYLIFGKEDKHRRVLYVDNMTTALKWFSSDKDGATSGKTYVRVHKRKTADRPCPTKNEP